MKDPLEGQAFETPAAAAQAARVLRCSGIHRTSDGKWMPCASAEELTALIEGGVDAYRKLSEKGLFSRAVGKLRHASVNPNARDADGDGLIQEGTTAQRKAKKVAGETGDVVRKRTVLNAPRKVPDQREPLKVGGRFERLLSNVDSELKELGGIGRVRTSDEGPLPEAVERLAEVRSAVEETFGKLETIEDYEAALQKGFPNAKIRLRVVLPQDEVARLAGDVKPLSKNPLESYGEDVDEIMKGFKGFMDGLLFKASNDLEAAGIVGAIEMADKDAPLHASVGLTLGNPSKTPVVITFNPNVTTNGKMDAQDAYELSTAIRDDLKNRDSIKKNSDGNWTMGKWPVVDSDSNGDGAWTAFHEWAHLKGVQLAMADMDQTFMTGVQDWVKTGDGTAQWLNDFPELLAADGIVARGMASLKADKNPEEIQQWLAEMGFEGIDLSNQEQLRAVYRALAARVVLAAQSMQALDDRAAGMGDDGWKKIDFVGGYANVNHEEGIAEFLALAEMIPETTIAKAPDAVKLPQIRERM